MVSDCGELAEGIMKNACPLLRCCLMLSFAAFTVTQCVAAESTATNQASTSERSLAYRAYFVPSSEVRMWAEPRVSSPGVTNAPASQTSPIPTDQRLQKFFVDVGVSFPEGSFVTYNENQSLLVVRNTPENLVLMDRALGPCPRPSQVTIE